MSAPTMMPNNAPGNNSGNRPIQPTQDKVAIKRVGIGSAFKMGCGLSMLIILIFGGIAFVIWAVFALISPSILTSISASFSSSGLNNLASTLGAPGIEATPIATTTTSTGGSTGVVLLIGGGCVAYILGIFLYGLFGGIGAAIYAFFYNLAGRWFGGIEIELKR